MTLRPDLYLRELRDLPHDLRWGQAAWSGPG